MKIEALSIQGLYLIKPDVFGDERGYFLESYSQKKLEAAGICANFVQDNESKSAKGVLRGLHFQNPPYAQAKLVRAIKGRVLDVAVDIRKDSKTYGKHCAVELNESNKWQFFIPEGFAHGFVCLEDDSIFAYKVNAYYAPESEAGLLWNSPELGIDWQIENPLLSPKDEQATLFKEFKTPF